MELQNDAVAECRLSRQKLVKVTFLTRAVGRSETLGGPFERGITQGNLSKCIDNRLGLARSVVQGIGVPRTTALSSDFKELQ